MLVGALAACGGRKAADENLTGKWSTTVDITDMVNQQFNDSGMGEILQLDKMGLVIALELKDDNTYTMAFDKDALAATMEDAKAQMKDGLMNYFAQQAPGVDVEAALAQSGVDLDEMMNESIDLDSMAGALDLAGQYKAEDGRLYLSENVDQAPDKSEYIPYTLNGDQLTLDAEGDVTEEMADLLPMVFQRVG